MLREAKSGALRALLSAEAAFEVEGETELHGAPVVRARASASSTGAREQAARLLYDRAGDEGGSGQEGDAKQSRGKIVMMSFHVPPLHQLPEVTSHILMTDTTDFF